jgi:hypothetical protein
MCASGLRSASSDQAVDGLREPDRDLDDVYLNVEPYTGVTMDYSWKVLVAVNVTPHTVRWIDGHTDYFKGVNPVVMPLVWAERRAQAT